MYCIWYIIGCCTDRQFRSTAPVSFTYGVASLQLAAPGAAALGVGGVVFLHGEDTGCLGNRWWSPVEGWGWHQSWGETLTGNINRLRLLLQSAGQKQITEAEHVTIMFTRLETIVHTQWSGEMLCDLHCWRAAGSKHISIWDCLCHRNVIVQDNFCSGKEVRREDQ